MARTPGSTTADRGQAAVLVLVVVAVLTVLLVGALSGTLPLTALSAILPSLLLAAPLGWAFRRPAEEVPVSALAANVAWILLTNSILAVALAVSA